MKYVLVEFKFEPHDKMIGSRFMAPGPHGAGSACHDLEPNIFPSGSPS